MKLTLDIDDSVLREMLTNEPNSIVAQAARAAIQAPHIQNFRLILVNRSLDEPGLFDEDEIVHALKATYWALPWEDIEVEVIKTYDNNHDWLESDENWGNAGD